MYTTLITVLPIRYNRQTGYVDDCVSIHIVYTKVAVTAQIVKVIFVFT